MDELNALTNSLKTLTEMDEKLFNESTTDLIIQQVQDLISPEAINQLTNQIIDNFEQQGLTKAQAQESIESLIDVLNEMVYKNEFGEYKKKFIDATMERTYNIFRQAVAKYHSYNIELPMVIDEANGAKVPTYAHDTDAAADLYAMEDQIIDAHSYGNMIKTGVKIQLPEGWLAMILPRSSMGTKTPLRLSNSVGLIDSGYRGELGVLYDNTSDINYQIHAGDRIAQLLVMPSYRFQAKVVDVLADSDRGEGGFGASGK